MFHEGGWRMGDLTDEDLNCRMFARDLDAVCVNVDYRLAPEFKFPTGVNDAYDAVKWCARTASPTSEVLPANPKRGFIVGGASAGGNFAAVMCQIARDERLNPPLTGQYLCVPALLASPAVPEKWKSELRSRTESNLDAVLKLPSNPNAHLDDELQAPSKDPRYSPLLHPDLAGLPPAFIQCGGLDPLRDEALLYERLLREEHGTPTRINVYNGFGHM
jgi:acetyl esterase/lipase